MRQFILLFLLIAPFTLAAHCQMPCGIYDDQMVYDKITEYYLTMFKAVKTLEHNELKNVDDYNKLVRWIALKDKMSDQTAELLTTYFLQQKLKPIKENRDLVLSIHKLLFLTVAIKQNVDLGIVKEFGEEWDHFKSLFHPDEVCKPVALLIEEEHQHHDDELKSSPHPLSEEKVENADRVKE